jgi:hypothetical protein
VTNTNLTPALSGLETALILRSGDEPYTTPYVIETSVAFRDQPVRHHRGYYVYPGRRVAEGDWPYPSPEECPSDAPSDCTWIGQERNEVLVCRRCGLDCT